MREYHFKYQNNNGGLYVLLAIFVIPFLTIFSSFFLLDYVEWIFWITIPLGLAVIVYYVRKFIKKSRSKDTITVDSEGFTSIDYGRVDFSDIHSIPPFGLLQAAPPSMRIRLHNGKKLVWQFDSNNPKSKPDILIFTAFREVLLEHLKQQTHAAPQEAAEALVHGVEDDTKAGSSTWAEPKIAPVVQSEVIEQLEMHKKRDINYKYITIPVGLVFGILMFARTCGTDLLREHKNKEFEGVRHAILSQETSYEENVKQAIGVAKTYA